MRKLRQWVLQFFLRRRIFKSYEIPEFQRRDFNPETAPAFIHHRKRWIWQRKETVTGIVDRKPPLY